MSIRTRTLQQLLDDVADKADVNIAVSGVRETNAKVTRRLNQSIQDWKRLVAEAGDDTFLLTSRTTTATSTTRDAANWAPYQYIAQPTGMMLVRGIDVWSGQTPIAMLPIDELERNDAAPWAGWLGSGVVHTGMPVFYRVGGTNAAGSPIIQLFPYADAVYTVDVRYVPTHTDLDDVDDLDTAVEFICGGERWVVLDAAMETLRAGALAGTPEYADMRAERDRIKSEMAYTLACRGELRKTDTRERRRILQALASSPWRGV